MKKFIIGSKYVKALQPVLQQYGAEVLALPVNPHIADAVNSHADLSVFYDGEKEIFLAPYLKNSDFPHELERYDLHIHVCDFTQDRNYPDDVQLNICRAGKYFYCNPETADREVLQYLQNTSGLRMIAVNQGYAACSALYLKDKALITSDNGICRAAENCGFDVLMITPGFIHLPGYSYGFIGGSAFFLNGQTLAFTGILANHPDEQRILEFLRKYQINPVFLTDQPIFDIGGAVCIDETHSPNIEY